MGSYHLFIAAVLLLVVAVREGLSLNCVDCNSFVRSDCDSNPLIYSIKCHHNATSCRKMEQEIYYDDDYHVRTIRQCAVESGPKKCIERTGTYRFKVWYCHCDGDDCNAAAGLPLSLMVVSLCGLIACLFGFRSL